MDEKDNQETETFFDAIKIARLHEIKADLERLQTTQVKMTNEIQELINERQILKKELVQEAREKIKNI